MATGSLIYLPKQSKPTQASKKSPGHKCTITAMDWIRGGFVFPGKPAGPPKPLPPVGPPPSGPNPLPPVQTPPEAR